MWKAHCDNRKADDVKVYTIMDHAPLSCVSRGKIVLIGDAAHPMAPSTWPQNYGAPTYSLRARSDIHAAHAQGGALSIEDAGALEILFADISSRDEVSKRLQLFQELRVPRNATTRTFLINFEIVLIMRLLLCRGALWAWQLFMILPRLVPSFFVTPGVQIPSHYR